MPRRGAGRGGSGVEHGLWHPFPLPEWLTVRVQTASECAVWVATGVLCAGAYARQCVHSDFNAPWFHTKLKPWRI